MDAAASRVLPVGRVESACRPGQNTAEAEARIVDPVSKFGFRQFQHEVNDGPRRDELSEEFSLPVYSRVLHVVEQVRGERPALERTELDPAYPGQEPLEHQGRILDGPDDERRGRDDVARGAVSRPTDFDHSPEGFGDST